VAKQKRKEKNMGSKEYQKAMERMLKEFFMEDVEVKLTGESSDGYNLDLIIDMQGFYLETSFISPRKIVDEWKRENNYKDI
jgi:hypothetical protein